MSNSQILENVEFKGDYKVEEFCIIGKVSNNLSAGSKTVFGSSANIRSHCVIYSGNIIGENFQTGHNVLVRESNTIGDNVSIGSHSVVEHHVIIGDKVRIHSQAFIPEESILEEGAWIGPNVVITNARYPTSRDVKEKLKGAWVGKGAIIGANSTILPGLKIGDGAIIGAGSVVTKDVPAGAVVAGNPARIINKRENIEDYK